MKHRRPVLLVCALAALLVASGAGHGASAAKGEGNEVRESLVGPAWIEDYGRAGSGARVQGIDGVLYEPAPMVVGGSHGELFYGPDFDLACGLGGRLETSLRKLSQLANLIEKSGRTVLFTVAPNKSAVMPSKLDPAALPHGLCDKVGLKQQNKVLDSYRDPRYLPLRQPLRRHQRQMYWKTDLHWTTVGASVYTRALAARLDPRLGNRQRYAYSTEQRLGGLNALLHIDAPETLELATPKAPVRVRTARGTPDWSGYPNIVFDHSWVSSPARRTWPGRTLLLGDSFTFMALENLRPIFRQGRGMWLAHVDLDDVVTAIKRADTVVLETVQIFAPTFELTTRSFRHQLRRALL